MRPDVKDGNRLEAIWKEEDIVDGDKVRALVVIFRTIGCWWSKKRGCLMCGYNQAASGSGIGEVELLRQLEIAKSKFQGDKKAARAFKKECKAHWKAHKKAHGKKG